MKELTNTPHDKNFRLSLSNIEVAKDFLNTHLPKQILKIVNLRSLAICPNSYITPDLKEKLSDILYKAKTTKNADCYIYTVVEHQSTATWDMPIRMVQYQLAIIDSYLRQYPSKRKIPIVIPLLVYNGKKSPYPYSLDIIKLFYDQELAKKIFAKSAYLVDITKMSDQEIQKHNIIGLLEFTQKHVRDQKLLKNSIKALANIINKLDQYVNANKSIAVGSWLQDYVNGNLHYLYYFANITNETEFTKELEEIDFIKRENIMGALARKIEQEGIVKGIVEGKKETALSMLAEGLDINLISKVTKLTVKEVETLKAKQKNNN